MKITIAGKAGSGKSTIAKMLSKNLGLVHYSAGDLWRQIASKKNISVLELNKEAESNPEIDKYIDDLQKKIGQSEDNFVVDARIAWYFIPDSIKIFLDVRDDVAVERIFKDDSRICEDAKNKEDMANKIQERRKSEIKRYKKLYGIDAYSLMNFDIIIDTSELSPKEIVKNIKKIINEV